MQLWDAMNDYIGGVRALRDLVDPSRADRELGKLERALPVIQRAVSSGALRWTGFTDEGIARVARLRAMLTGRAPMHDVATIAEQCLVAIVGTDWLGPSEPGLDQLERFLDACCEGVRACAALAGVTPPLERDSILSSLTTFADELSGWLDRMRLGLAQGGNPVTHADVDRIARLRDAVAEGVAAEDLARLSEDCLRGWHGDNWREIVESDPSMQG